MPAWGTAPPSATLKVPVPPAATASDVLSAVTVVPLAAAPTATAMFSVTAAAPLFVTTICLVIGSVEPVFRMPKFSVAVLVGSAAAGTSLTCSVRLVAEARPASRRPAPSHCTSTAEPNVSVVTSCAAVFTIADLTCAGV